VHCFAVAQGRALDSLAPNVSCPAWPRLQNAAELIPGNASYTYLELDRAQGQAGPGRNFFVRAL
jgi:hypothetical protein